MTSQDSAPAPDDGLPPGARPDDGEVPPGPEPVADEELPRLADAALVRRAPRFGAFIRTGAAIGAAAGVLAALLVRAGSGSPSFAVIALTALGLGALGALVAAWLAVLADRRSQRRADRDAGPRT